MALKDIENNNLSLKEIKNVISLIKDENCSIHKFKNTAIYYCFKHNQRVLESNKYPKS